MKYLLFITIATLVACGKSGSKTTSNPPPPADTTFRNPLLSSGPDPWVIQKDTMYYYMHTLGNRLAIYSTSKMSQLSKAVITPVWTPPTTGPYSKDIWAPELHYFQNKWFMYFAADDGNNDNHRIYALENDAADPTQGAWTFKGKVADTTDDRWAIDASTFEYKGKMYLLWSGWQGSANTEQDIYIALLSDPVTFGSKRVLISAPSFNWEKAGAPPAVNEGPEAIINPSGQLFLTFSASGCWTDSYCLGLLTLKPDGDPLNPSDWTKSPNPVFSTQGGNGAYAPGHNGFFTSRDGKQNWILYHANSSAGQGCGDARNPRMQSFTWNSDGTPNFGTPVMINFSIPKPGGE